MVLISNERSIVTIPLNQAGYPPKITSESQLLADAIGTADKKELEKVFIEALLEEGYISSFNHGWDACKAFPRQNPA